MNMKIEEKYKRLGDAIDSIISADFVARGVSHELYEAAREKVGASLTMSAAQRLKEKVNLGDPVLIFTGWPSRSWLIKGLTETDGPVGAAVIARAVEQGLGAIPIFVMEKSLKPFGEAALRAAGLIVQDLETALKSKPGPPSASVAAVIDFPVDWEEAERALPELIEKIKPAAMISIELPGASEDDRYYNVTSREVPTELIAKADVLFREAPNYDILTIGIGDGGNELGMGKIKDSIAEIFEHGHKTSPVTDVDVLIAASISNWGGFGLAAAIFAVVDKPELLEEIDVIRITERVVDAGAIDGLTSYVDPKNDGTKHDVNRGLMTILSLAINQHIKGWIKG